MANLINPETKAAKISDTYVNWSENQNTGKKSGGIVVEVEFDDGTKKQKLLNLTEKGAEYTVKTLRDLGWKGTSFADFESPQLVGMAVSVVLADATDKDGNVKVGNDGKAFREIAFINPVRGYRRASHEEAVSLARHFDGFLGGQKPAQGNPYAQGGYGSKPTNGYQSGPDDDLPF